VCDFAKAADLEDVTIIPKPAESETLRSALDRALERRQANWISPKSTTLWTQAVRVRTPRPSKTERKCIFTVFSLILRDPAIAFLVAPSRGIIRTAR
jgi:hypothetical protein